MSTQIVSQTPPAAAVAVLTPDAPSLPNPDHTLFVNAARWLRDNGWLPVCYSVDGWREYTWSKADQRVSVLPTPSAWQMTLAGTVSHDLICRPKSVQQAIDLLVSFWVLPVEFASWFVALPQRTPGAALDINPPKPDFQKLVVEPIGKHDPRNDYDWGVPS